MIFLESKSEDTTVDKKNGSSSLEDKPEFKKLLSDSPTITGSPHGDPPEPEDLIKAIQDLENSASSDAIIRNKISSLPPEVSEAAHLEKLQSAKEGRDLMKKVKKIYSYEAGQKICEIKYTSISREKKS